MTLIYSYTSPKLLQWRPTATRTAATRRAPRRSRLRRRQRAPGRPPSCHWLGRPRRRLAAGWATLLARGVILWDPLRAPRRRRSRKMVSSLLLRNFLVRCDCFLTFDTKASTFCGNKVFKNATVRVDLWDALSAVSCQVMWPHERHRDSTGCVHTLCVYHYVMCLWVISDILTMFSICLADPSYIASVPVLPPKEPMAIERSNLLSMMKLSIKVLIQSSLSLGRTLDSEYPPLQQFFVVLEHCLKHGLKGETDQGTELIYI